MREIVPAHQLKRRLVEEGRIRLGQKGSKGQPQKLSTLRFTSQAREAIKAIAGLYGGTPTEWKEAPTPGQLQVVIEAPKVPVVLPPDPLGGTPTYEAWSGGGCLRRCDGIDCTLALAQDARPDAEPAVVACPCREQNQMICKPRTRLNVVLREIPFGGTWRVESTGWNAAEELPGMVEMVMAVQERGMVCGLLGIGERMRLANGRTTRFVVPELSLPESIDALAAGSMAVGALGPARTERAALPAPEVAPEWYEDDDEIHDAEIVDDPEVAASVAEGPRTDAPTGAGFVPDDGQPSAQLAQTPKIRALHAGVRQVMEACGVPDPNVLRHALVQLVTEGRSTSSGQLSETEASRALDILADLLSGDRRFLGFADDGHLRVSGKREAS